MELNRVPGNFYISTSDWSDILYKMQEEGFKVDFSFKINHFSFGKKQDFLSIKSSYPNTDIQHPLDGFTNTVDQYEVSSRQGQKEYKPYFM
jgi:hypothetical protein